MISLALELDDSSDSFVDGGLGFDFGFNESFTGYLQYQHSQGSHEIFDSIRVGIYLKF